MTRFERYASDLDIDVARHFLHTLIILGLSDFPCLSPRTIVKTHKIVTEYYETVR